MVLTVGSGHFDDYEAWICAYVDNKGKIKYQAIYDVGSADGRNNVRLSAPRQVDLSTGPVPEGVKRVLRLADK